MTYRFVPRRLRMAAQLSTLIVTAIIGASIAVTPEKRDAKLSVIEQAMRPDTWAFILIFFGIVGFCAEVYMTLSDTQKLFWLVSLCHIVLCSVLVGYSVSAFVGVLTHNWWNFGAPALGFLLAFWHYIYVQRRPKEPVEYVE